MKKVYRCRVCGDIHFGIEGPERCPTCGHVNTYYERKNFSVFFYTLRLIGKKYWRCIVCNDIHFGKRWSALCPTCKHQNVYVEISREEFDIILLTLKK
ncbi:MAG: hypothetical protein WC663_05635 [Patescibacteria group bacterium]|jgi:rubrerythrin